MNKPGLAPLPHPLSTSPHPVRSVRRIEAVILAGGLSSRMGSDKARLRLGGKSLVAHVRKAAIAAGLPVRVLRRDLVPRCGPLGGVYTALRTSRAELLLFLSCDAPFITRDILEAVLAKFSPQTRAVFVGQSRVGFPFALRRNTLEQVSQLIAARQFSLQFLASAVKAKRLRLPSSQQFAVFNINTQTDYRTARELWIDLAR